MSRSSKNRQAKSDGNDSALTSKPPSDKAHSFTSGLYIVATPIGNARDITLRALALLNAADAIACEDTRVTRKLLSIHGIPAGKLISYHEHNADKTGPQIIERINSGEIVALVSDAGTPMINDPGYVLAEKCRESGLAIEALPGPSAVTNALVLAGLPTERFMYCGFPPNKQARRRTWLGDVSVIEATLVFLESPVRLAASLKDMSDIFGAREAAVVREMTKKFEEVRKGSLTDLSYHYDREGAPKGEITIVVGPPGEQAPIDDMDLDQRIRNALATESVRKASDRIAAETGISKREIYNRALVIKDEGGH